MQRILIIEDEPAIRKQLAQILRFEGFETIEAANGKLGVAAAMSTVPDLVVCDIMMPELDGFGVLLALRENPQTALTPFIFVTAKVANHDRRHGMEEGADDYITKPYDPDALVGSIRRRLEKRARQVEEGRRQAEEVSLAVATSVPQVFLDTLARITTVTNLVARKYGADDPQVSAMHEVVAQEAVRLRRMMRRLNLYAQLPQLYAHRFELEKTGQFAKQEAVLERIARCVCQSWHRTTDLVIAAEQGLLPIREEYLVLVVEELIDNACKFSEPGSPIEVCGHSQAEFWSVTVINRGPGLSKDQIAQIGAFKQFWNENKKPQGLGLGLALTQGIARLHGCEFALCSGAEVTTAILLVPRET
jgi:DNA-binding response OmpR family regulator/anti-sigma regulatory factor (Ser/Thr protein kinase)